MKLYTFNHAGGEELLKEKGLLKEITDILEELKREDAEHDFIDSLFQNKGWEIEKQILDLRRDKGRFCSQCGARYQEDDRFCSSCGTSLKQGENLD